MVSKETLVSCFQSLECNIQDEAVIDRCFQLCSMYNLEEEVFAEMWVRFSVRRFLNFDPTLDTLKQLEDMELKKSTKPVAIPNVVSDVQNNQENITSTDMLDMYNTTPSTVSKQIKRTRSPGEDVEKEDEKLRAVDTVFTPSTFTPRTNTPSRGLSASVRGKILLRFGPDISTWQKEEETEISIGISDGLHVPKDMVYMYEMITKQGYVLSLRCENFGSRLCCDWKAMGEEEEDVRYVKNVKTVSQTKFRTFGRISSMIDKATGLKYVILEGCKNRKGSNNAPFVRLDLNNLKHYSIFPGQIVAVEGMNAVGNTLHVKEMFTKGYAPFPEVPQLSVNLRVYIAAGPFTPSDNLNYQPLWDLMEHVKTQEPDVLILIGPLIEYTHPEIQNLSVKDTFQDLFEKILGKIMQYVKGKSTRVVLVPSNRDAHHEPIFPTPEYSISQTKILTDTTNLHLMPDPCVLDIEGLHIGVTSVDSIKHLGHEEISNTPGMDRLGRLADHILSQSTFYPLYPPSLNLNLDTTLWKTYVSFKQQPHILILPSDVRYYCKMVNECLVLNPERLQKNIYAKLCIPVMNDEKWDPNNVSCEIAKV